MINSTSRVNFFSVDSNATHPMTKADSQSDGELTKTETLRTTLLKRPALEEAKKYLLCTLGQTARQQRISPNEQHRCQGRVAARGELRAREWLSRSMIALEAPG